MGGARRPPRPSSPRLQPSSRTADSSTPSGSPARIAGNAKEAEAAFRKAAALDPSNPEPLFELATIAVGQNQVAEAVGMLEKYVGMTGQSPKNLETAKGLLGALKKK